MSQSFIHDTDLRLTEEGAENGTRRIPENTVLVVVRGMSLAKEFRIAITRRPMTFNQDVKALQCVADVDPQFMFYALKARKEHIRDLATEASHGTKKLETNTLNAFQILVPDTIEEQRAVAAVALNYDDLIENNRRRIGLLEDAARQLYKEWFVRFRFPGHEHVKIIDGVPEGWTISTIQDVCFTTGGGTPSTQTAAYWADGDVPWFTPTDVTRNPCLALLESATMISEAGLNSSSAKMVPAGSILMTSRASVGFFGINRMAASTNQGFINIVPHDANARMFILQNLMWRVDEIRSHAGGATYKEINKSRFRALLITMPPSSLLAPFEEQATLLHGQVERLHIMNQKLAKARDLLLPRLMNGSLTV